VAGDLHDPRSIERAVAGARTIICTAHGGDGRGAHGPRGIEAAGIPSLIRVAQETGVEHFIYLSTASEAGQGAKLSFGRPLEARHSLARASVILSLDADFLADGPEQLAMARDFARGRAPMSMPAGESSGVRRRFRRGARKISIV